jgi:hypothetical protein
MAQQGGFMFRSRSVAHLTLIALLVLACAATPAAAAGNRSCGLVKARGELVQVQTFGAAGPKCRTARRIIRRTYKRRSNYKGYECSKGRFPQLWGCFHKDGSRNALAYYYDR